MTRKQSASILAIELSMAMKRRGLTAKQLAERVGSNPTYVRAHLSGRRTPTVHKVAEYAVALGIKPSQLFACLDGAV